MSHSVYDEIMAHQQPSTHSTLMHWGLAISGILIFIIVIALSLFKVTVKPQLAGLPSADGLQKVAASKSLYSARLNIEPLQCDSKIPYGYALSGAVDFKVTDIRGDTPMSQVYVYVAKKDGPAYTTYATSPTWCQYLGGEWSSQMYCKLLIGNGGPRKNLAFSKPFVETGTYVAFVRVGDTNSEKNPVVCSGNPICKYSKSGASYSKVNCGSSVQSCDNGSHAVTGRRQYAASSIELIVVDPYSPSCASYLENSNEKPGGDNDNEKPNSEKPTEKPIEPVNERP